MWFVNLPRKLSEDYLNVRGYVWGNVTNNVISYVRGQLLISAHKHYEYFDPMRSANCECNSQLVTSFQARNYSRSGVGFLGDNTDEPLDNNATVSAATLITIHSATPRQLASLMSYSCGRRLE